MSVYTIAATILAIIGIISAIIGTGFFVVGNNYKQSIVTLKEALDIYKENVLAKDSKIKERDEKIVSLIAELDSSRKQNMQVKELNLNLQNRETHWREEVIKLHKKYNLPVVDLYADGTSDGVGTI